MSDVIDHVECCPDDQVEGHWMSQCGSRPHIARVLHASSCMAFVGKCRPSVLKSSDLDIMSLTEFVLDTRDDRTNQVK